MKTKEIVVWYKLPNNETSDFACYDHEPIGRPDLWRFKKTTMVIEISEKKIEISESELRECYDTFKRLDDEYDRKLVYSFLEHSKQKLFGND